ncbi:conserved hypothetical protein [gamma proteobacterium HTCC5015]|nr:conserved hypothetical protein [gamma proteobacterium HTCC5015]
MIPYALNKEKMVQWLAAIALLLLFPGFYFYHQAVAAGLIPSVLGGFYSPVSLVLLLVYCFTIGQAARKVPCATGYTFALGTLLIWMVFWAFYSAGAQAPQHHSEALLQLGRAFLAWGALFFTGLYLEPRQRTLKGWALAAGLVIFLSLLLYVLQTGRIIYYAAQLHQTDNEIVATYQGFARSALITSFLLVAVSRHLWAQLLISSLAFFVLFVLSARSEFVALAFSLGFFFSIRSWQQTSRVVVPIVVFLFSVLFAYYFFDVITESRHFRMTDLAHDSAWQARILSIQEAWGRIKEQPLTGQFAGHFTGSVHNLYAHNVLSVWDGYGFWAFTLFLFVTGFPAGHAAYIAFFSPRLTPLEVFYCLVAWTCLLLMLVSKSMYWVLPGLSWGLYVNVKHRRRGLKGEPK